MDIFPHQRSIYLFSWANQKAADVMKENCTRSSDVLSSKAFFSLNPNPQEEGGLRVNLMKLLKAPPPCPPFCKELFVPIGQMW